VSPDLGLPRAEVLSYTADVAGGLSFLMLGCNLQNVTTALGPWQGFCITSLQAWPPAKDLPQGRQASEHHVSWQSWRTGIRTRGWLVGDQFERPRLSYPDGERPTPRAKLADFGVAKVPCIQCTLPMQHVSPSPQSTHSISRYYILYIYIYIYIHTHMSVRIYLFVYLFVILLTYIDPDPFHGLIFLSCAAC
jgi:hypothetical protein